ncbi:hypothetical protein COO91_05870 [Nostoc flagelliforme CCNUN1]|uniref:Uncharacterized protein n=1 Tax=Nostoc flagelliforme CCNUN1 TaxID=2038116 RepID=A0A2K8SX00_9NOSO|nr:hypothetical protein COO91_05870 [Nostoc flagelliforme CCNUN1]
MPAASYANACQSANDNYPSFSNSKLFHIETAYSQQPGYLLMPGFSF